MSGRAVCGKIVYQLSLPVLMWIVYQLTWYTGVFELVSGFLMDGIDPGVVIYSVCPY